MMGLPALADDSVEHSGQASKHSALASVEGLASAGMVASAVAATPLILSAGAGMAIHSVASDLHQSIEVPPQPRILVITDKIITTDVAPNQAMQSQAEETQR